MNQGLDDCDVPSSAKERMRTVYGITDVNLALLRTSGARRQLSRDSGQIAHVNYSVRVNVSSRIEPYLPRAFANRRPDDAKIRAVDDAVAVTVPGNRNCC